MNILIWNEFYHERFEEAVKAVYADTAPEAFRIGEDGLAEGYQEIPADSIDNAKEAEADCPVGAIQVK